MESNQFIFAIEGLDIAELLATEGKKKLYIKTQLDKYHYFIHHLLEKTKYNRLKEGAYIKTSFKIMSDLCGIRYFKDIKEYLLKWGIVEANGKWLNGEHCQGYRLTEGIRVRGVVQVGFTNSKFLEKLNNVRRKKLNDLNGLNKFLLFHLNDLGIDAERATLYVRESSKHIIENTSPSPLYVFTPFATEDSAVKDVGFHLQSINEINIGRISLSEDKFGRIHSNFTNLPSELRQFLYHKYSPMERLVNIDIVNSQPFFLACLILKHYSARDKALEEDVESYIHLCLTGRIYEHFTDQSQFTRDEVKDRIFSVFYGRNTSKPTTFQRLFQRLFPNVCDFITSKKDVNFRHFSWLMQKEESSMVIGTIINKIRVFYGTNVFVATIHDSIVCLEKDQKLVEEIILEEISNKYNVIPELKHEILSGDLDKQIFKKRQSLLIVKYDALGNAA